MDLSYLARMFSVLLHKPETVQLLIPLPVILFALFSLPGRRRVMRGAPEDPVLREIYLQIVKKRRIEVNLDCLAQKTWKRFEYVSQAPSRSESSPSRREATPDLSEIEISPRIAELERAVSERNERIARFLAENIRPLRRTLNAEGIYETVLKLLAVLTEAGESVGTSRGSDGSVSYRILRHVSLLDHSINVAEIGLELTDREIPYVLETSPGKYLLIFLGHDVGKAFADENYATGDHPILSARVLSEMIPESYPHKQAILRAVEKHHLDSVRYPPQTPEEYDLYLLQTADRLAREREIASVDVRSMIEERTETIRGEEDHTTVPDSRSPDGEHDDRDFPRGVSVTDLLSEILPLVNRTVTAEDLNDPDLPLPPGTPTNSFVAVSQPNGVVYVRPDVLHETFTRLVLKRNLERENAHLLAGDKNRAIQSLVKWLIEQDVLVPGQVKPGYIGRWYRFMIGNRESKAIFVPIRASAFGVLPGDLEKARRESPKASMVHSFERTAPPKKT